MTFSDPEHNPYSAPHSEALSEESDPETDYRELVKKRAQQASALAAAWIIGGLLTAGMYTWFWFEVWTPLAVTLMVVANLIGLVWVLIGVAAAAGARQAHQIGLVWSYLTVLFFIAHCNVAGIVVVLMILQGHRLHAFDNKLRELAAAASHRNP